MESGRDSTFCKVVTYLIMRGQSGHLALPAMLVKVLLAEMSLQNALIIHH